MVVETHHTTLTKLRDLYWRVDDLPLDADEKAVLRALLSKEIARCERRQRRQENMLAKPDAPGPNCNAPPCRFSSPGACLAARAPRRS
jgi:hypothetical protein